MPELVSDGTTKWMGGMDTSRSPADIGDTQYSKACNVIIPNSLGGIRARFGFHCCILDFESKKIADVYRKGNIQGEGYFISDGRRFLVCVVDGHILRFTQTSANGFFVECVNAFTLNDASVLNAWVIQIPNGCIVNNGKDLPMFVNHNSARRTNPANGEINVGTMGVYVQFRLFYVDKDGKQIIASDFLQPLKITREDTNIVGFMCPDESEYITAITKQKSIIGTVEGGNLIWSSTKDLYSVDVRGTRSEWATPGSTVGKVSETVPGFSASSSYSFEPFNTNIYFRTARFGIAGLKQSEQQFVELDSVGNQSAEADYYLEQDTTWMLRQCYTRACNRRLFTTVTPERTKSGYIIWNGILSFHPAAVYSSSDALPKRFESVFTGVRPWCMTSVTTDAKDILYIHSHDKDEINRLYFMNENADYDLDESGAVREIEGFIETKAYVFDAPLLLKTPTRRFYRLNLTNRNITINSFSRPEVDGPWAEVSSNTHLICRDNVTESNYFPQSHKGQTRPFVVLPNTSFGDCYEFGYKFSALQYRLEFKGPLNLDSIITVATMTNNDLTVSQPETCCITLVYEYRPDYSYSIRRTE